MGTMLLLGAGPGKMAAAAWSPLSLPNLLAWIDFSDLSTLFQNSNGTTAVASASDPIGYAADKSGNGKHFIQATSGQRPLYAVDGNVKSAQFDGSDDLLAVASAIGVFPAKRGLTAAVYNQTSGTYGTILCNRLAASTTYFQWLSAKSGTKHKWDDTVAVRASANFTPSGFVVETMLRTTDTNLQMNVNSGSNENLTIANNQPQSTTCSIGARDDAGERLTGKIAQIVICGATTEDDRVLLQTFLTGKAS